MALAASGAVFFFGACGGNGTATGAGESHSGHSMTATASNGGHNDQDVMFAQMMIPHHRQALEMARMAPRKAASPKVKALARRIERAQGPEITKMTGWLRTWGAAVPSGSMGHGNGMMSEHEMAMLEKASGKSFDKMFLEMMIKHHEGAVTMARTEQASGSFGDAKALAGRIITSQSAEIEEMRRLLAKM